MPTIEDVKTWKGLDLRGEGEDKIGSITDIYLDRATGEPEWVAVRTGLFGMNVSFVPIARARPDEDHIDVPYSKDKVKDAPNVEADGELAPEQERRLYDHYGVGWGDDTDVDFTRDAEAAGVTGDEAMTRSEEELVVGTRKEETGRARLRKYIVTDEASTTVPVAREEARVEREPITEDRDRATDGPALSEEEHEVTLRAEEPEVGKRVVPKERVRLGKETHVENTTVSGQVRKEQVDADVPRR